MERCAALQSALPCRLLAVAMRCCAQSAGWGCCNRQICILLGSDSGQLKAADASSSSHSQQYRRNNLPRTGLANASYGADRYRPRSWVPIQQASCREATAAMLHLSAAPSQFGSVVRLASTSVLALHSRPLSTLMIQLCGCNPLCWCTAELLCRSMHVHRLKFSSSDTHRTHLGTRRI
jgi:hypothetical protein